MKLHVLLVETLNSLKERLFFVVQISSQIVVVNCLVWPAFTFWLNQSSIQTLVPGASYRFGNQLVAAFQRKWIGPAKDRQAACIARIPFQ